MKNALVLALFIATGTLHGMEQAEKSEQAPRPLAHTESLEALPQSEKQRRAEAIYFATEVASHTHSDAVTVVRSEQQRFFVPVCWFTI